MWDVIAFEGLLRSNGDVQTSFLNVHVSTASVLSCTADKMLQTPPMCWFCPWCSSLRLQMTFMK